MVNRSQLSGESRFMMATIWPSSTWTAIEVSLLPSSFSSSACHRPTLVSVLAVYSMKRLSPEASDSAPLSSCRPALDAVRVV